MQNLNKPIREARRRLWVNRWFSALGWCLSGALVLFIVAVCLNHFWLEQPEPLRYYAMVVAGLAIGTLTASLIWAFTTCDSLTVAAAKLDEAAGLKERLSTGMYCANRNDPDPFAQAVVADADHLARGVTPARHLPLRFPHSGNYAGVMLVVALLAFWLVPTIELAGKQEEQQKKIDQQQGAQLAQVIEPKIDETLKQVGNKNPSLKPELDRLTEMKADRIGSPLEAQAQGIKKIEAVKKEIDELRKSNDVQSVNEFKRLVRSLSQNKSKTPVGDLSQALAKGDFKAAQQAVEKLKKQLDRKPKNEAEKQQAEQLKQELQRLSDQLNKLASDQKRLTQQLANAGMTQKDVQEAMKNLKNNDIEKLKQQLQNKQLSQQQVQQMVKKMQQCQSACKMASAMGQQCSAAAGSQSGQPGSGQGQGQSQGAAAMGNVSDQLAKLQQLQGELASLDQSMSELNQLQDQISNTCTQCQGSGKKNGKPCGACNGSGQCNKPGSTGQMASPNGGMGPSPVSGKGGAAPVSSTTTSLVNRRSDVHTEPGRIISQEFIDGEQVRGEVTEELREVITASDPDNSNDVRSDRVPKMYHKSIREFYKRNERLVEGDESSNEE